MSHFPKFCLTVTFRFRAIFVRSQKKKRSSHQKLQFFASFPTISQQKKIIAQIKLLLTKSSISQIVLWSTAKYSHGPSVDHGPQVENHYFRVFLVYFHLFVRFKPVFDSHSPVSLPPSALNNPFVSTLAATNLPIYETVAFRVSSGFDEAQVAVSAPSRLIFFLVLVCFWTFCGSG